MKVCGNNRIDTVVTIIILQYLKNGCTQYFTSPDSAKKISANRMSKQQQAKGGLRDPILDDVEDFQRLHQVSIEAIVALLTYSKLSNLQSY